MEGCPEPKLPHRSRNCNADSVLEMIQPVSPSKFGKSMGPDGLPPSEAHSHTGCTSGSHSFASVLLSPSSHSMEFKIQTSDTEGGVALPVTYLDRDPTVHWVLPPGRLPERHTDLPP